MYFCLECQREVGTIIVKSVLISNKDSWIFKVQNENSEGLQFILLFRNLFPKYMPICLKYDNLTCTDIFQQYPPTWYLAGNLIRTLHFSKLGNVASSS